MITKSQSNLFDFNEIASLCTKIIEIFQKGEKASSAEVNIKLIVYQLIFH